MALLARFITDESGATAIEYGLIAAAISIAIIAAVIAVHRVFRRPLGRLSAD
jgi:pilus assembly protein Flp/PilA